MGRYIRLKTKRSQRWFLIFALLGLSVAGGTSAVGQTTSFTYQGRLADGSAPASGVYDMKFKLYDEGGNPQGAPNTVTLDNPGVQVTNGVFTVQLDFGAGAFTGGTRLLEISVRPHSADPNSPAYATLSPRQPITSTPYAIRSSTSATADSATNFSGGLSGDVTGTQNATVVGSVGGQTAADVASGAGAANAATSSNTAGTIVKRDASGNFSAGTITASLNGNAATATTASGVGSSAGNSVVNAINDASTSLKIDGSHLFGDFVRFAPGEQQNSTGDRADPMINLRGNSQNVFRVNHSGGFFFTGQYDGGSSLGGSTGGIPVEGAGTRIMWYPEKAAFRAGYVTGTQWDDSNTGYFSTAFGQNNRATGDNSFAAGKSTTAFGGSSVAIGEGNFATGFASVALGYGAHTNARRGAFVFADNSVALVYTSDGFVDTTQTNLLRAGVPNSATWRVVGGYRIFTAIDADGNPNAGVTIQSGAVTSNWGQTNAVISTSTGAYLSTSGVWTDNSSRALKTNFLATDARTVLQKLLSLPIQTWNYKVDGPAVRHIGVMAQDFYAAFGLGADNEHITAVDTAGVTMAAIQGLHKELEDRDAKIFSQQQQISDLQTQLAQQQDQLKHQQTALESLKQLVCANNPNPGVCKEEK